MSGLTTRQLESRRLNRKRRGRTQLKPGDVLQDRYEIIGILGIGGFGSVYKARDKRFANVTRLCAVKEMVNMAPDPQMREITVRSFEREAGILATLEHPSVPDVYDYFTEDDRSYLVMEFIRGKNLETLLNESDGPISQDKVLTWALQICEVLEYLHSRSPEPVVFRDLKPANVMLDVYDRIHVIDFGIAKVFHGSEKHTMVGTEGYAPPEQYRGESSPAVDVYALGATMHHLLTKQDPRMEVPFSFADRPIRNRNSTVTAAMEAVVMRCLAYNVSERYPDAKAVREALEALVKPQPATRNGAAPTAVNAPAHAPTVAAGEAPAVIEAASDELGIQPLWTFKCEDEIRSAPQITDDFVLVGAYDNNLYALKRDTGDFIWKFPASDAIAGSPAIYRQNAFIGSADKHLYSIQLATGRQNWRFAAGGPIYSSPKARFDHVFFGSDDVKLYAVNVNSGRAAWTAEGHSAIRSSPHVDDERVFFGTEGGYVFCVDLAGKTRWQFQAKRAVTSTPTVADEMVFVGSMDSTVYALDASSGWAVWRFRTQRPIVSSPVVLDETLFIGSADGNLYAIDIYSGRQRWAYKTGGQVASSPAVWEDAVYFGSTDGHVYSLTARKGDLRWKFDTGGYVISSPVIHNGVVYIGSTTHVLYALPA